MVLFQKSLQIISHPTRPQHTLLEAKRELSTFLMRYQQFASHAYCDAILETDPTALPLAREANCW
jgi:hypothetical protein